MSKRSAPLRSRKTPELAAAVGEVVRRHRAAKGLSQFDLAAMVNMERTYISMLERGINQPTLSVFLSLAEALSLDPQQFLREVLTTLANPKQS